MSDPRSGVEALRVHAAERSRDKRAAVAEALHQLSQGAGVITVSEVARSAGVSREFIYSHAEIRSAIAVAARKARRIPRMTKVSNSSGLHAERATLAATVARQKERLAEQAERIGRLELEKQRHLGEQLVNFVTVDPEAHAAVRLDNERLNAANAAIHDQLTAAKRTITGLEADLAASRQAHAEDVAVLRGDSRPTVVTLPSGGTGAPTLLGRGGGAGPSASTGL